MAHDRLNIDLGGCIVERIRCDRIVNDLLQAAVKGGGAFFDMQVRLMTVPNSR